MNHAYKSSHHAVGSEFQHSATMQRLSIAKSTRKCEGSPKRMGPCPSDLAGSSLPQPWLCAETRQRVRRRDCKDLKLMRSADAALVGASGAPKRIAGARCNCIASPAGEAPVQRGANHRAGARSIGRRPVPTGPIANVNRRRYRQLKGRKLKAASSRPPK
jgi:hypothetical protein